MRILGPYGAFLTPYLAVAIGLYGFHSAWAAVLLFHAITLSFAAALGPSAAVTQLTRGWRTAPGLLLTLAGCLAGAAVYLTQDWIGAADWPPRLTALGLHGASFSAFLAYLALIHPPLEELLWRGLKPPDAAWISPTDLVFAGYHALVLRLFLPWPWIVLSLVCVATASAVWRWCQRAYGGLAIPVASHLAADTSLMLALYWLLPQQGA